MRGVSIVIPTRNRKEALTRLLRSIYRSNLRGIDLEIIVSDDNSDNWNIQDIKKIYPKTKIVTSSERSFVSATRNRGLKTATKEYVFFVDDDNLLHEDCIQLLSEELHRQKNVGVVAPLNLFLSDRKVVVCAGISRNKITSITKHIGWGEEESKYKQIAESEDFPNAFMTRKSLANKVGGFDEKEFPIHYEESDFCRRIAELDKKIILVPQAKIYHDVRTTKERSIFETQDPDRLYWTFRNRYVFHKRHTYKIEYLLFLFFFSIPLTMYYIAQLLKSKSKQKKNQFIAITKGSLHGISGTRDEKNLYNS